MSTMYADPPARTVPDRSATRPERHLHAVATSGTQIASGSAGLRLTRRGRVVVLLAAMIVIGLLTVAFGSSTAATDEAGMIIDSTTVTVQPGDTLWRIATAANPGGDVRDTVDDIMRLNSLPSASGLQMGTKLAVPVYAD